MKDLAAIQAAYIGAGEFKPGWPRWVATGPVEVGYVSGSVDVVAQCGEDGMGAMGPQINVSTKREAPLSPGPTWKRTCHTVWLFRRARAIVSQFSRAGTPCHTDQWGPSVSRRERMGKMGRAG